MNKYQGLLLSVSNQYRIFRGDKEIENDWKSRLIYSICGMMGYASLWDNSEEPVSIVHLKKRISEIVCSYNALYPEISDELLHNSVGIANEIQNQFLSSGIVYHSPNRITPSLKREELFSGILFQRGISLDDISCVSGIGFYSQQNGESSLKNIKKFFALEYENLQELWYKILSAASWESNIKLEYNLEYLQLEPLAWVNEPNKTGTISILRTKVKGLQLYYLYRYTNSGLEVSQLPNWRVDSNNYRALVCACLAYFGTLPPIEYFEDGPLVHVRMSYLLPPRELNLLKLYSWPERFTSISCNFKRKISTEVFTAIQDILCDTGYRFKEGVF